MPDAPPTTCPKCEGPFVAGACARCGLLATRALTFVASTDTAIAAELVDGWRTARRSWQDPATHDQLLQVAWRHGGYAWLAARYKERARTSDPIARERLALVLRASVLTLAAASTRAGSNDGPAPYRATRRMLILLLGFAALGVALVRILAGGAH